MEAAGGGLLVDDAEVTAAWVADTVVPLLSDRSALETMARAAASVGQRDADELLADLVDEACADGGRGGRRGLGGRRARSARRDAGRPSGRRAVTTWRTRFPAQGPLPTVGERWVASTCWPWAARACRRWPGCCAPRGWS